MTSDRLKDRPVISVIMANYNCESYLRGAIESVLSQSLTAIELILVDDGSRDGSVAIAEDIAAKDSRLRVFSGTRYGGPAPVRNFGLDQARGDWVAVVDSDDLIHPERLSRMLNAAMLAEADILIDDLLIFRNDAPGEIETMFTGGLARAAQQIDEAAYVRANFLYGRGSQLGYAKPLMRRAALLEHNIRYNETMPIGEDYDLVVRLLAAGCNMVTMPDLLYFYRKHGQSISHRLNENALSALLTAAETAVAARGQAPGVARAHRDRLQSIRRAIGFDQMLKAIKDRKPAALLRLSLTIPSALTLLRLPLMARISRLVPKAKIKTPDVAVIVRQRIVGATNGSSTYLLAICRYLASKGRRVSMYWPTPKSFGRWPVLSLKPEMAMLDDSQWRGGFKNGNKVFSKDIQVWWALGLTAIEAVLLKLKLIKAKFVKPAASALMEPYRREDFLFLARHLQGAKAVIVDYAFNAPYLPYALSNQIPTLVVMHDLFSSRKGQFDGKSVQDAYGSLDFDEEMRLLGLADCVIAIQKDEAKIVDAQLTDRKAIVAPMANDPDTKISSGDDDTVFFVGSNAAPNVLGLEWFFAQVWPLVLARRPATQLKVAGNVGWNLSNVPANVKILGMVDDLGPLYREAGVVISPLTTGSGLKIKIIEALARAKATVVTRVTLQGIQDIAGSAVRLADEPEPFAAAIIDLLDHPDKRLDLAQKAVDCVQSHFSSDVCFREILTFINTPKAQ